MCGAWCLVMRQSSAAQRALAMSQPSEGRVAHENDGDVPAHEELPVRAVPVCEVAHDVACRQPCIGTFTYARV